VPEHDVTNEVVPRGTGVTDFDACLQPLLAKGYRGYLLIEMAHAEPKQPLKEHLLRGVDMFRRYERGSKTKHEDSSRNIHIPSTPFRDSAIPLPDFAMAATGPAPRPALRRCRPGRDAAAQTLGQPPVPRHRRRQAILLAGRHGERVPRPVGEACPSGFGVTLER
jgi:hypothetical protein